MTVEVAGRGFTVEVAVLRTLPTAVLLGTDVAELAEILGEDLKERPDLRQELEKGNDALVMTRAAVRKEKKAEEEGQHKQRECGVHARLLITSGETDNTGTTEEERGTTGETDNSATTEEERETTGETDNSATTEEERGTTGETDNSATTEEERGTTGETDNSATTEEERGTTGETDNSATTEEERGTTEESATIEGPDSSATTRETDGSATTKGPDSSATTDDIADAEESCDFINVFNDDMFLVSRDKQQQTRQEKRDARRRYREVTSSLDVTPEKFKKLQQEWGRYG